MTRMSTDITVVLLSCSQAFIRFSGPRILSLATRYAMTGIATVDVAITVKTAIATTSPPTLRPASPIATPAAAAISRFFGLTAESRKPKPRALTGVNESIAAIHFGVACSPPRPRHCLTPTSNSRTPSTILVQDAQAGGALRWSGCRRGR